MAPCCRCTALSEQPGTTTWWGKGTFRHMTGNTSDQAPSEVPMQQRDLYANDLDADEEEKLEKKLDAKPVPVIPPVPAPSSTGGGSAASSSAMPVVVDLTGDD